MGSSAGGLVVRYAKGRTVALRPPALVPGQQVTAVGLSDAGEVVGQTSRTVGGVHAVVRTVVWANPSSDPVLLPVPPGGSDPVNRVNVDDVSPAGRILVTVNYGGPLGDVLPILQVSYVWWQGTYTPVRALTGGALDAAQVLNDGGGFATDGVAWIAGRLVGLAVLHDTDCTVHTTALTDDGFVTGAVEVNTGQGDPDFCYYSYPPTRDQAVLVPVVWAPDGSVTAYPSPPGSEFDQVVVTAVGRHGEAVGSDCGFSGCSAFAWHRVSRPPLHLGPGQPVLLTRKDFVAVRDGLGGSSPSYTVNRHAW